MLPAPVHADTGVATEDTHTSDDKPGKNFGKSRVVKVRDADITFRVRWYWSTSGLPGVPHVARRLPAWRRFTRNTRIKVWNSLG